MLWNRIKRKNDAPRPRRVLILVVLVLGIAATLGLFFTTPSGCVLPVHQSPPLTGYLYYRDSATNAFFSYNLKTQQSAPVRDDPARLPVEAALSPNRLWRATWQINLDKTHYDLILEDARTREKVRHLGMVATSATRLIWSPDSQWLVFDIAIDPLAGPDALARLWMIHTQTGETRLISHEASALAAPRFAPDSTRLAYLEKGLLRVVDLGPSGKAHVTVSGYTHVEHFVWSPDGAWLAYTSMSVGQPTDIWAVRADGTQAHSLVSNGAVNQVIDWRP